MCAAWAPVARWGRPVTMASLSSPSARPQSVPRNGFSTGTGLVRAAERRELDGGVELLPAREEEEPVSPWSSMPLCLLWCPT